MKVGARGFLIMEITGALKNYEWGKKGSSSLVAELFALNSSDFKIEPQTPYAELWMGTHPSGKSKIKATGMDLPANLPFLLKILSVSKALSIQVHPNKTLAARLHAEQPKNYPDANHKPEMAIAVTPFKAMCGFRPYSEIVGFLEKIIPLKKLVVMSDEDMEGLKENNAASLKICYGRLFSRDDFVIRSCFDAILENYTKELCCFELLDLFKTLHCQYPYDVGVLSIFFLNIINLRPGQSLFLGANEIHAYISGDCIECMATSDNVIRAGLTPKFKDTKTLLACVNFEGRSKESQIFEPIKLNDYMRLYAPIEDFALVEMRVPPDYPVFPFKVSKTGSIMIVLNGEGSLKWKGSVALAVKRGSIIYFPPTTDQDVYLKTDPRNAEFLAYVAMENNLKYYV